MSETSEKDSAPMISSSQTTTQFAIDSHQSCSSSTTTTGCDTTTNTIATKSVVVGGGANNNNTINSIVEERVKVDRKRFEQMLSENSNFGCDADSFFRRVMRSTNTQIMWPPKLKPGTKSKKDPHVRITGSPNSINAAKEIIFEQLDTRRNRVTLKMDVAFTDHSHIIGKGGRSIQRVMDETGCHIHFPDSNRTNTAEKSNQVSIAGSAEGVEQSRCRIREMLPVNLQFDLPLNNGLHSPPTLDPQSPQLQAIQQNYGITISFRCDGSKCSNNSYFASSRIITVAVRGARSHLFGLRQGLSVLIEYLTGFRADTINVPLTMTLDVAVQHHSFIAGRANCNIRAIMQSTGVIITMPDNSNTSTTSTATSGAASTAAQLSSGQASSSNSISSLALSGCGGGGSGGVTGGGVNNSGQLGSGAMSSIASSLSSIVGAVSASSSSVSALTSQSFHSSNPNLASAPAIALGGGASNRKTAIVVKGPNFESVYGAWQDLLGYLPLILIFDLKEGQDLDPVQVTKLMEQMRQISILIKPKQRQNTKSIVVRGPEKDSRLLFEVRKQILKLDDSELQAFGLEPLTKLQPQQQQHQPTLQTIQQQPQPLQHHQHQQQQQPNQHQQQHQQLHPQRPNADPETQLKAIRAILEPNLEKTRHPTPYWAGLGFSKSVSEPMIKEKLMGPLFSSNIAEERRISYSDEGVIQDLGSSLQSLSFATSGKLFINDTNNNSANNNNASHNNSTNANMNIIINNNDTNHNRLIVCNKQQTGNVDANNNTNVNSSSSNTTSSMDFNNNSMQNCDTANIGRSAGTSNASATNTSTTTTTANHPKDKISSCLRLAMFLGRIGLVQYLGLLTQHGIDLEMLFSLNENDFAGLGMPFVHRRKLSIAIAEVKSSIQNERTALSSIASTFDAAPGAERSRRQKARGNELNEVWPM